jgi:hypothetical protein
MAAAEGLARDQVVVVTGAFEDTPDEYWAAAQAAGTKRDLSSRSKFQHVVLKAADRNSSDAVTKNILLYAAGPRVKAIIVSPAPVGTANAFLKIREAAPEIIKIAVNPLDNNLRIESSADLVLETNVFARGYLLAYNAKQLGLTELVFLGGSNGLSDDQAERLEQNAKNACDELGLRFSEKPDGVKAQDYLAGRLAENGKKIMLWVDDRPDAVELLQMGLAAGATFTETPQPSLLKVFPQLFPFAVDQALDDYPKLIKKAEKITIDKGAAGHAGTWIFPAGYVLTSAAIEVIQKNQLKPQRSLDINDLQAIALRVAAGTKPVIKAYLDPATGVRARNHFLMHESDYLLGKGFLPSPAQEIPARYFE